MVYFRFLFFIIISVIGSLAQGQGVVIRDTSLAKCLRREYPQLFNNGLMDTAKASNVSGSLFCNSKFVINADGVQYFKNISALHLENNIIDTIPNLGKLTKLKELFVQYNSLRYLPGIERLTSLEEIYCYKNEIVMLPSLTALPNLVNLTAHLNKLSRIPDLGAKPKLKIVYLNENELSELTDFSQCPQLVNVRLYGNPLTFRELMRLTNQPGYDTLFKLNPTLTLKVGYSITAKEADTLLLSTGIDQGVRGMKYNWYKNGKPIATTRFDSLLIPSVLFSDSGNYSCQLSNDSFTNVTFKTDDIVARVESCLDMAEVVYSTTNIDCLNNGSLLVATGRTKIKTYQLVSNSSQAKYIALDGKFTGLSEPEYTLYLTTETGCARKYPQPIQLLQEECEEVLLSPNNDGQGDTYHFEDTGKVVIYDKRGNVVKSLTIPAIWDGSSDSGRLFSGFYVADINNGKRLLGITLLY